MPHPVLTLQPGEHLLINGTLCCAHSRLRLALLEPAEFVFGKRYLAAEDATTPARRFYWLIQQAYAGPLLKRLGAEWEAARLAPSVGGGVAMALLDAGDGYAALREARRVLVAAEVGVAA